MEGCVAAAHTAFEVQVALQNRWKALVEKSQRLSQKLLKKAELQSQIADLQNHCGGNSGFVDFVDQHFGSADCDSSSGACQHEDVGKVSFTLVTGPLA